MNKLYRPLTSHPHLSFFQDVMLWDLEEARLVQRFFGRPSDKFAVRNCFGGRNANFILSGSDGIEPFHFTSRDSHSLT
jgi:hypothetical protein